MNKVKSEAYLNRWLSESARRISPLMIKRHIIKHAKQLNDPSHNAPVSWAASMLNLLRTYEKIHGIQVTIPVQLYKLYKKYNKNPKRYSPPPGGKIPKGIKVKRVTASTK